ncbi:MAG: hypothetical protein JRI23_23105 [Deltaproteobacteria bacterium]|jgi:hypothetical protein|nr:hypothetical protein [Deltaproteobacteria bacterium]MBW2534861.1 hypothetical protein [Deltaproteobacteria bacterium]
MKKTIAAGLSILVAMSVAACGSSDGGSGTLGGEAGTGGTAQGGSGFGAMNTGGQGTDCPDCTDQATGVGTNDPFDPDSNDSDGVGLDDDGALVLDASNSNVPNIIWIANTGQNTVSKVDTTTYQELGRYRIGTNDPSRTSVNSLGDVFVGNRSGNSLTKVSAAGVDCPDTNNDGQVTTSTGAADVLAWGQDDCVMWDVPVPNSPHVRGVAAQDVVVPDPIPDDPQATSIERYVWVGGTSHRTAYKFDGETGALLIQTEAPTVAYGLALDGNGNLWFSGRQDNALGRIDTNQCHDQASCDTFPVCTRTCTGTSCTCDAGCPTSCDQAAKERINITGGSIYGITVDFKQRIWLGGDAVRRYNPLAPEAQRLDTVSVGPFIHGIAADADGSVWGAAGGNGVVRLDGDNLNFTTVAVGNAKGMAVDKDGKIWAISLGNAAHVIEPGQNGLDDYTQTSNAVTGLVNCYTYSDMTGQQLALATNEPGYYREVFEGCPPGDDTYWAQLHWDVDRPAGTQVRFRVRSAATVEDLANEDWMAVASLPPDASPASLADVFDGNYGGMERYLEVEVILKGTIDLNGLVSPRVQSFGVMHSCPASTR